MFHRNKKNPFRFIKLIHRIQSTEIKPHGFGQKNRSESVDISTEHLESGKDIPGALYCYPPSLCRKENWCQVAENVQIWYNGLIEKRSSCHGDEVHRRTIKQL